MICHLLYSFYWKVVKMDKRRNPSSKRTIFKFGDCNSQKRLRHDTYVERVKAIPRLAMDYVQQLKISLIITS